MRLTRRSASLQRRLARTPAADGSDLEIRYMTTASRPDTRVEHLVQRCDVADRLGHLLAGELDHPVVHPEPRQLPPARRAGLGGLVLVVGKHEVRATSVDVEADAERSSAIAEHSMCQPGRPVPPRRLPPGVLPRLVAPSTARSRADPPCARRPLYSSPWSMSSSRRCDRAPVTGVRAHPEVDIALRRIGVPGVDQRLHVVDDRGHRL